MNKIFYPFCDFNFTPYTEYYKETKKNFQSGFPVVVYARFPTDTDHRYVYARWTGSEWIEWEIVKSGRWFPETPSGKNEPGNKYILI